MTDEIEGAAALATAGLAAHALSDPDGQAGAHSARCVNCGTPLTGRFCHACGQSAHLHRSVVHVFEEFLHGLLHVDTKAWRTVPLLLVRPGQLTRDYVFGRRARYISPLGLFLFTIFLMFFVFGLFGSTAFIHVNPTSALEAQRDVVSEAEAALREARDQAREAQDALADASAPGGTVPAPALAALTQVATAAARQVALNEDALRRAQAGLEKARAEAGRTGAGAATAATPKPATRWQDQLREAVERGDVTVNLPGNPAMEAKARQALLNPDLTFYKIQQKAYKLSFLLVPLSLPFLWLLFAWKRNVRLYDHVIFLLYSLSFMSILFVVVAVLTGSTGGNEPWTAALTAMLLLGVPPVHMFLQLRGAYQLGWFSALWRTGALLFSALIVLGIFVGFIALLGLLD